MNIETGGAEFAKAIPPADQEHRESESEGTRSLDGLLSLSYFHDVADTAAKSVKAEGVALNVRPEAADALVIANKRADVLRHLDAMTGRGNERFYATFYRSAGTPAELAEQGLAEGVILPKDLEERGLTAESLATLRVEQEQTAELEVAQKQLADLQKIGNLYLTEAAERAGESMKALLRDKPTLRESLSNITDEAIDQLVLDNKKADVILSARSLAGEKNWVSGTTQARKEGIIKRGLAEGFADEAELEKIFSKDRIAQFKSEAVN